jgi:hypothetical protein
MSDYEEYENWIPTNKGDAIAGQVVEVGSHDFGYGDTTILNIKTPDGKLASVKCFGTVLANDLAQYKTLDGDKIVKALTKPGDHISVVYKGEGNAQPGKRPPKLYSCKVEAGELAEAETTYTASEEPF